MWFIKGKDKGVRGGKCYAEEYIILNGAEVWIPERLHK